MKQISIIILCFLASMLGSNHCANILALEGTASFSHHIWMRTLMIALANRGHNVTSISPDVDKTQTPNLHYIHLENMYTHLYTGDDEINFVDIGQTGPVENIKFIARFGIQSCEGILTSKGVHTLLNYPNDYNFDLVVHDNLLAPCLIGFLHKFGYPPLVHATAFNSPALSAHWLGSPFNSYVKPYFSNGDGNTFLGRVENFGLYFVEYFIKHYYVYPKMNALSKKVFPDAPKITELEKHVKLVLINSHPAIEVVEPLLPNVIPVGGLQLQSLVDLPEDLKKIADSAKDGLVLFSLGTNVRSDMLGSERIRNIIEAFRNFPKFTFLWKFESNKLSVDIPTNVHIRPWLPQTEILNHKNTILFITHSGLLSTQESVWFGVPMLCLPVFADQYANSELIKRAGVGEVMPISSLNSTNLKDKMAAIFNNRKYRINAAKLSKRFRDQPELPLERAVWWLEWLLRNPDTDYLNSPARDLNVFSRHEIDVILFLVLVLWVTLYLLLKLVCVITKCCRKPSQSVKVKKN